MRRPSAAKPGTFCLLELVDGLERQRDPLVGRTLGGVYAVERRLGAGGFGAVYAGRHVRTGRRYALKVLRPDRALLSPEARERFRREAEALASLGHAGIVAIHDYARSDGFDFLVMDLLEGEDLASRIAHAGPLPLEIALRIVEQVADALALAHRQGIVHRDLKPANVFLARNGVGSDAVRPSQLSTEPTERAVLLDFGLAKVEAGGPSLTASGEALGTPQYMAPEQASGDRVDARTDVYALGAILFEMLSGAPPFDGPSPAAVLVRALTTPAPSLRDTPGVPSHVAEAVARALAKEPDLRPQTVVELVAALRIERREAGVPQTRAVAAVSAVSALDTERPPPTRVSEARTTSPRRPKRAVVGAAAALLLFLTAIGGAAYVIVDRSKTPLATGMSPTGVQRDSFTDAEEPVRPVEAPSVESEPLTPTGESETLEPPLEPTVEPEPLEPSPSEGHRAAPSIATTRRDGANERPSPRPGAPPIEPSSSPFEPRRMDHPRRAVTPPVDAPSVDAPSVDASRAGPAVPATPSPMPPPGYDPSVQQAMLISQAERLESRADAVDTLMPPIDLIRQGLGLLPRGVEPRFCGDGVDLPRGSDEPSVVNASQSLRRLVDRACAPFEALRNPSPEAREQMRNLLDRDLPRAIEMTRDTSTTNQPADVAQEVEANLLAVQRLLDGVVEGRRPFPCDAPEWADLRRSSDAGNAWARAAANRALQGRDRVCNRLGTSREHLTRLSRQLHDHLDSLQGSLLQLARQFRATAIHLRGSAQQMSGAR